MPRNTGLYNQALDPGRREIRVLTLHAGHFDSPIFCTLSQPCVIEQTRYCALSYVWGNPEYTLDIIVNGVSRPVTTNLEAGLRHIRRKSQGIVLWIDALCIDNDNVQERNEQVSSMGEIYSSAARVIIWLGEDDRDGRTGLFDHLQALSAENVIINRYRGYQAKRAILALPQNQWFRRVWVIQEMALAKEEPTLYLGSKTLQWSTLVRSYRQAVQPSYLSYTNNEHTSNKSRLDVLDGIRSRVRDDGGIHILESFLASYPACASDRRDKIYALRGLLNDQDRQSLIVDYAKPLSSAFLDLLV